MEKQELKGANDNSVLTNVADLKRENQGDQTWLHFVRVRWGSSLIKLCVWLVERMGATFEDNWQQLRIILFKIRTTKLSQNHQNINWILCKFGDISEKSITDVGTKNRQSPT